MLAVGRARPLSLAKISGLIVTLAAAVTLGATGCSPVSTGLIYPIVPKAMSWTPGTWSQDQGVDINAPCGAKLAAVASGRIIAEGIGGFGPYAPELLIDSGPLAGRMVYYGHVEHDYVPVGAHVKAGQWIAQVGTLGISYACHVEMGISPRGSTQLPGWHATSGEMINLLTLAYFS